MNCFRVSLLCMVFIALTGTCLSAMAGTVIFAETGSSNAYPFNFSGYSGEYQQVYSASSFNGPVDITAITFFTGPISDSSITGNYTLDLSTTSASPLHLSTNYASNTGADNAVFFNGSVSSSLTFTGTPFLYDPSKGNLLLDVEVHTPQATTDSFLAAGCSNDTNRVFNDKGDGAPILGLGNNCSFAVPLRAVMALKLHLRSPPFPLR